MNLVPCTIGKNQVSPILSNLEYQLSENLSSWTLLPFSIIMGEYITGLLSSLKTHVPITPPLKPKETVFSP